MKPVPYTHGNQPVFWTGDAVSIAGSRARSGRAERTLTSGGLSGKRSNRPVSRVQYPAGRCANSSTVGVSQRSPWAQSTAKAARRRTTAAQVRICRKDTRRRCGGCSSLSEHCRPKSEHSALSRRSGGRRVLQRELEEEADRPDRPALTDRAPVTDRNQTVDRVHRPEILPLCSDVYVLAHAHSKHRIRGTF